MTPQGPYHLDSTVYGSDHVGHIHATVHVWQQLPKGKAHINVFSVPSTTEMLLAKQP